MGKIEYWVEDDGCYFTPGGDPLWSCPRCGNGKHVYGIESPYRENKCKDCGLELRYPSDDKCVNCKYFHRLKCDFKTGWGFKESSCCIALTRCNEDIDDYDSFVVECRENDRCEMFSKR